MSKLPYEIDGPYRAGDTDDSPVFKQVMCAVGQGLLLFAAFAGGFWCALTWYA